MQLFLLTLLLGSGLCYRVYSQINADRSIKPYVFEDVINSTIESFRDSIPESIDLDNAVLDLPDEANALLKGNASVSNLKLTGLHDFQLTALNFALIGTRLNFTLKVPTVEFYTDYTLDLSVADAVYLYGDGSVSFQFDDLEIVASAQANLTGGISVDDLRVQLYLGDAKFSITGLLNDEEASQLISAILDDLVAKLIDENQELVTQILSPIVESVINIILGSVLNGTSTDANADVN